MYFINYLIFMRILRLFFPFFFSLTIFAWNNCSNSVKRLPETYFSFFRSWKLSPFFFFTFTVIRSANKTPTKIYIGPREKLLSPSLKKKSKNPGYLCRPFFPQFPAHLPRRRLPVITAATQKLARKHNAPKDANPKNVSGAWPAYAFTTRSPGKYVSFSTLFSPSRTLAPHLCGGKKLRNFGLLFSLTSHPACRCLWHFYS